MPFVFFIKFYTFQFVIVKRRQDAAIPKLPYLTTFRLATCTLSINYFCSLTTTLYQLPNALNGHLIKAYGPFWGIKVFHFANERI